MKFKSAFISNFAYQFINLTLTIVCIPIYLEILDLKFLGVWNLIALVLAWSVVLEFGIPNLTLRKIKQELEEAENHDKSKEVFLSSKKSLLILNGAAIGIVSLIVIMFPNLRHVVASFSVVGIGFVGVALVLKSLDVLNRHLLLAHGRYVEANIVALTGTITKHGFALLIFNNFSIGHDLLLWPLIISTFLAYAISLYLSKDLTRLTNIKLKAKHFSKADFNYAKGFFVTNLGSLAALQVDKLFLVSVATLEEFAIYGLAVVPAGLIYAVSVPIQNAVFPQLLRLYNRDLKSFYSALYAVSSSIFIPLFSGGIFLIYFGEFFLAYWLNDADLAISIYQVFRLLVIANIFGFITGLIFTYGNVVGCVSVMSASSFLSPIGLVICAYPLYKIYGIVGIGLSWFIIEFLGVIFYPFFTLKTLGKSYQSFLYSVRDAMIAAVGMLLLFWVSSEMHLGFQIGLAGTVVMITIFANIRRLIKVIKEA